MVVSAGDSLTVVKCLKIIFSPTIDLRVVKDASSRNFSSLRCWYQLSQLDGVAGCVCNTFACSSLRRARDVAPARYNLPRPQRPEGPGMQPPPPVADGWGGRDMVVDVQIW